MGVSHSNDSNGNIWQSTFTEVSEKIPQWTQDNNIPKQLNNMNCLLNINTFIVFPYCTESRFFICYSCLYRQRWSIIVNLCQDYSIILKIWSESNKTKLVFLK